MAGTKHHEIESMSFDEYLEILKTSVKGYDACTLFYYKIGYDDPQGTRSYAHLLILSQNDSECIRIAVMRDDSVRRAVMSLDSLFFRLGGFPSTLILSKNIPVKYQKEFRKACRNLEIKHAKTELTRPVKGFLEQIREHFKKFGRYESVPDIAERFQESFNAGTKSDGSGICRDTDCLRHRYKLLPYRHYELIEIKYPKVQLNFHVKIDSHFYSVPYANKSDRIRARISDSALELYVDDKLIATHPHAIEGDSYYITDMRHMPEYWELDPSDWTGTRFLSWARQIGPNTEAVIRFFLKRGICEMQGYLNCCHTLKLADKGGNAVLEEACRTERERSVLTRDAVSFQSINRAVIGILEKEEQKKSASGC